MYICLSLLGYLPAGYTSPLPVPAFSAAYICSLFFSLCGRGSFLFLLQLSMQFGPAIKYMGAVLHSRYIYLHIHTHTHIYRDKDIVHAVVDFSGGKGIYTEFYMLVTNSVWWSTFFVRLTTYSKPELSKSAAVDPRDLGYLMSKRYEIWQACSFMPYIYGGYFIYGIKYTSNWKENSIISNIWAFTRFGDLQFVRKTTADWKYLCI